MLNSKKVRRLTKFMSKTVVLEVLNDKASATKQKFNLYDIRNVVRTVKLETKVSIPYWKTTYKLITKDKTTYTFKSARSSASEYHQLVAELKTIGRVICEKTPVIIHHKGKIRRGLNIFHKVIAV
jgi:hypothetical protein